MQTEYIILNIVINYKDNSHLKKSVNSRDDYKKNFYN